MTGRFRPKNWPKTVAKSNGKLGNKRIFPGELGRSNYSHFFGSSSPALLYIHCRGGVIKRIQKMGGTKKRQKNQKMAEKWPGNRKIYRKEAGEKKGSATGRFRPKNCPKTEAKSNGKLGNNGIFFGGTKK